ncbi:hypothetical protein BDZ88DRAFT_452476 [Geranomyces variabilis]|nr:hypothetical protein BDZ88DRAFT_452476 [Geranomyces variabilis]KAJ3133729.1 hypothetical protein HDU90_005567 [Geranomyces variabilis]
MVNLILSLGLVAAAATSCTLAAPQTHHRPPVCLNLPRIPNEFGCPPNPNLFPHCDNIPHVPNDIGCPPNPNINGIPGSNNNIPTSNIPPNNIPSASCLAYKEQCVSTFAACGDNIVWDCLETGSGAVGYCRSCTALGGRFVDMQVPGVVSLTPMDPTGVLPADFDAASDAFWKTCLDFCPTNAVATDFFWENGVNHAERAAFCACGNRDAPLAGFPVKALVPKSAITNTPATPAATAAAPLAAAAPGVPDATVAPAASAPAVPAASSPAAAAAGPSVPSSAGKTLAGAGVVSIIAALVAALTE